MRRPHPVCLITADYRSPQTNISSPQTNSNVWESYLEDGKLPQTTFYLPQTNFTWWKSYKDCKLPQTNSNVWESYLEVFEMNCSRKHVIQGPQLQAMSGLDFITHKKCLLGKKLIQKYLGLR